MNQKLFIKTWGCQMNEYDSLMIINQLKTKQYIITDNPKEADILILNTCSIREKAQEKLFHQLGRWKKLKNKNKNLIIAVGGCVATQEGKDIYKRANYINIIFGTQTVHKLPEMIDHAKKTKKLIIDISFNDHKKFNIDYIPIQKKPTAFISIMEGCNKYCSFCIVPYTRGHEISRSLDEIVYEISYLSDQGIKEVNLLGQNVNSYLGKGFNGKIYKFSELLQIISEIDGIDRIRFTTSNPFDFTDDIIYAYTQIPKIVSFLHLPVQSGSDRILKLMKRLHTIQEYKKIINKLTLARKNIQISSDFIVGFPGETQKDFEDTMKLIEDINFDMSFSFIYSKRPGTPASNLIDNTNLQEKKERLYILQKKINEQTLNWSQKMLGTTQKVLVEQISKKNCSEVYGKTENNRIVTFKGSKNLIGKIINVKIIKIHSYSLKGQMITSQ
ncbi:tRNA-2-methylthio-N(6)-dimethylallyladenosine synthase [Buchnera aphidicola (Eriosoma grossulariae)]|uniref:tRNA (N6-isopentenyl adenosine(37)-C2)-methylthiotransferase MiaB n=1 Tax=Buchnera aphidicola TaxID=9 RepID=UPI0034641E02